MEHEKLDDVVSLDGILRTSQVIIGALVSGVVFFLIVVVFVLGNGVQPWDGQAVTSFAMAGFAVVMLFLRAIVPGVVVSAAQSEDCRGYLESRAR